MTPPNPLTELADRVQALTSACREMDEAITLALNPQQVTRHIQSGEIINVPEWTRSLDLVVTLVPENWYWAVGRTSSFCGWGKSLSDTSGSHDQRRERVFRQLRTLATRSNSAAQLLAGVRSSRTSIKGLRERPRPCRIGEQSWVGC